MTMLLRHMTSLAILCSVLNSTAWAHPGHETLPGINWATGFLHPFLGLDHLLVAVAVGLFAARVLGPKAWMIPTIFLTGTVLGMGIGRYFPTWPVIELGIAATLILSGGLLFSSFAKSLAIAFPILIACGFYHGFVHAVEMPVTNSSSAYLTGLLVGTGAIHLMGIIAGRFTLTTPQGLDRLRWAGAAIAVAGIVMIAIH